MIVEYCVSSNKCQSLGVVSKFVCVCRISCGFLGAFFVYLNRQVVLIMRRPTALTRFLTKQQVTIYI